MVEYARYSMSYMFFYSERPGTPAARKFEDDVPLEVKKRRLTEVIELQTDISRELNAAEVGKTHKVLIEGDSKKSDQEWKGRTTQNRMVVFPKLQGEKPGDYVTVKIVGSTSATLFGERI